MTEDIKWPVDLITRRPLLSSNRIKVTFPRPLPPPPPVRELCHYTRISCCQEQPEDDSLSLRKVGHFGSVHIGKQNVTSDLEVSLQRATRGMKYNKKYDYTAKLSKKFVSTKVSILFTEIFP